MKRIVLLFALFLGTLFHASGSDEIFTKHLRGSQIKRGASIEINPRRFVYTNWQVVNPTFTMRLYIAEDRWVQRNHGDQISVMYRIDLHNTDNTDSTIFDTLTVDYSTSGSYKDIDIRIYPNVVFAICTINDTSGTIYDDVILEMCMSYPRYTASDTIRTASGVYGQYLSQTNELLLTWDYLDGADEYDVEWLFVDNPLLTSHVRYDFRNATRITTSNNYYHISLAYPKGSILYRVRGRGSHYSSSQYYPVFGPWSYQTISSHTLPALSPSCRFDYMGLEDSLTWQYTASYAEDGKRKEFISFYDGSLRKRQEVTVMNTDSVAIVGEYFYDHVGRQALESVPVPTLNRGLRYYGTNGTPDGVFNGIIHKSDYDSDTTIGNARPFPMNSGSAIYYSSANPFVNHIQWPNINQVPQDSGYTYSHTRYLGDGTDRIHSQSVPGTAFKMGGGHETRYVYGNPSQVELDRLFGNEVGDASHYQKVMAMDANGEVTVSYYDMKERLIASAIIPSATNNVLLSVDNAPDSHKVEETIFFGKENRSYTKNIAVGEVSGYRFQYVFNPSDILCDTCGNVTGCMNCRYRIVFSLWDSDNLSYVFLDTLTIHEAQVITHDTTLLPGNYQLYKSVALVEDSITEINFKDYADRQRQCVQYDRAKIAPCYTPCEEYAMKMAYITSPDPSNPDYVQYLNDCQNSPQNPNTECEARLAALKADMSPGGQYFDNIRFRCPSEQNCMCEYDKDINGFLMSICPNRLTEDTDFRGIMRQMGYSSIDTTFWNELRREWTESFADVMIRFHPEYHLYQALCNCSEQPEQHIFDSIFFNTNSYIQAEKLGLLNPLGIELNTDYTIQRDFGKGYQPFEIFSLDPLFDINMSCCPDKYDLIYRYAADRLLSYWSLYDSTSFVSVWWLLFDPCQTQAGESSGDALLDSMTKAFQDQIVLVWAQEYGCSVDDARWLIFKSIYLYLKEEIRYTVLPACLLKCDNTQHTPCGEKGGRIDNCCYSPEFEWGQQDLWSNLVSPESINYCDYFLRADTSCQGVPITSDTCNSYCCAFRIRFLCNPVYGLDNGNIQYSVDSSMQIMYDNCCEDCETYANSWMEEMHDCILANGSDLSDSVEYNRIRQRLINWCVESCDQSRADRNFANVQRISIDSIHTFIGNDCYVVYPNHSSVLTDCACDNYQAELNAHGLTFWSDAGTIADSLADIVHANNITDIISWNNYCKEQRYMDLMQWYCDTSALYNENFPEQFRCRPELSDYELCTRNAKLSAAAQDTISFYEALDSLVAEHMDKYKSHCMDYLQEHLVIKSSSSEFLYTLYYYDQADNLIKTVPPQGVVPIMDSLRLDSVRLYRQNVARYDTVLPGFIRPDHKMVTNYRYNTLNQIIQSRLPDHDGDAVVYYDILARPIFSQDAQQKISDKYSYTLYDEMSRVIEVGQVQNSTRVTRKNVLDTSFVNSFLDSGARSEITHTYYDTSLLANIQQLNLRNRISAVAYYDNSSFLPLGYQTATHYSYDVHGNVKRLIQDIPALNSFNRNHSIIEYDYDLVSGNVNRVWFNKNKKEQFMHRYRYDADNRITHVYTSNTSAVIVTSKTLHPVKSRSAVSERLETRYFYLPGGSLSRMELGQKQIQGVDYAYTLQWWLKDINGYKAELSSAEVTYDIGRDGYEQFLPNRAFAFDAFSSSLYYYSGDYVPILGSQYFNKASADAVSLFNGNISALTTSFFDVVGDPLLKLFRYDKINRIKLMQTAVLRQHDAQWPSPLKNFFTSYTYDYNGNLLSLQRRNQSGDIRHFLRYSYPDSNNRLTSLTAIGLSNSQYEYDAIGNLLRDEAEDLDVRWNAAGKVQSIEKGFVNATFFRYSATGQRQVKQHGDTVLYYIHDATGNVMCIYRKLNDTLVAIERPIYGSKRLGELKQEIRIVQNGNFDIISDHTIGLREYELTDHLGNVMTTVLDRKSVTMDGNGILFYRPHLTSIVDYYPFGYPISERSYDIPHYRNLFNGQEVDNEVYGNGALHAFEYRMHDTRIGRFWSVDPLSAKFPWNSPYAFAENSPVGYIELEGLEKVRFGYNKVVNFTGMNKEQVGSTLKKYKDYHHGNISVGEIMSTANDNEYWDVSDMKNVYMKSIGTCIEKYSATHVSKEIRQRWYQWMTQADSRLDGGYDIANQGTVTAKDWVVGLGFVGAITGIGEIAAAGEGTIGVVVGLVNSLDDAFGIFTKGDGSLSQDLTPEQAKVVTNSAKTVLSAIKTGYDAKKITKESYNKLKGIIDTIISTYDTYDRAKTTIKDEQGQKK